MARTLDQFDVTLSAKDIAEWRGVSLKTVYRWHEDGDLRFAQIKHQIGRLAWSREKLRQWAAGEVNGLTMPKLTRAS